MRRRRITFIVASIVVISLAAPAAVRLLSLPNLDRVSTREMAARYAKAGMNKQALAGFVRAIEENPDDVRAHNDYIIHLYSCSPHLHDDIDGARQYYRRRYEQNSESALNSFCMGLAQIHFDNFVDIRKFYAAIKSDPEMPQAHYQAGHVLLHFGKEEHREFGAGLIREEIALNPSFPESYETLFQYLVSRDREVEALDTAEKGRVSTGAPTLLAAETAQLHWKRGEYLAAGRDAIAAKLASLQALVVLALALAAAAAWFITIWRQDILNPAPRLNRPRLNRPYLEMLLAFFAGMLIVLPAQAGYLFAEKFLALSPSKDYGEMFSYALGAGVIEETAMFFVLWFIIWKRKRLCGIVDGILLCAAAAVGFSAIESAISVRNFGVSILAGRFFVTSALHVFSAGIMGYFLTREKLRPSEKPLMALAGLAIAILFHATYNALLYAGGVVGDIAFLLVAAEMIIFRYLYVKAAARGPYRAVSPEMPRTKTSVNVVLVAGCISLLIFSAIWSILSAFYRDFGVTVRLALLNTLGALLLLVLYNALQQGLRRTWHRATPRFFLR